MRFPISLHISLTSHFIKNFLKKNRRFPLVLMLEPTHRCNLSCAGCDRIRLNDKNDDNDLTLSQCIEATLECGAPVVTVTGGEPFLYRELKPLIKELLNLKRHVYLCTNGLSADSFIEDFTPHPRLTLNFHLDGMEETHDRITNKAGTFKKALESIKKAKQKGFRISTNTSVYKNSDITELERLFSLLKSIQVDGILVSPAFSYESVQDNIFLNRDEIRKKFKQMSAYFKRFPCLSTPIYTDFLQGKREMRCTPWGNPTRNPLGWKSPCYLITDTYFQSFSELMEETDWDKYESGKDPRCKNCMVHCGYEASVLRIVSSSPRDLFRLAIWNLK